MPLYSCINLYNAKHQGERYVNCALWLIMLCQCRFTSCNQSPTLVGSMVVGEAAQVSVQGNRMSNGNTLQYKPGPASVCPWSQKLGLS